MAQEEDTPGVSFASDVRPPPGSGGSEGTLTLEADGSSPAANKARRESGDSNTSLSAVPTKEDVDNDESVLDKIKTSLGHAPLVERVRTAAHRFHFHSTKTTGVSRFFHPTGIRTQVRVHRHSGDDDHMSRQESEEMALIWRKRDERKGRNSIYVPLGDRVEDTPLPLRYTPKIKSSARDVAETFKAICSRFPYWDMSFWVAWTYTIGSLLFVLDGVLAWGAVAYPDTWTKNKYAGPFCFFVGALLYQIGAVTAYLEAVNDGSFHGATLHRLLNGDEDAERQILDDKIHRFFSNMVPHHHHHSDSNDSHEGPTIMMYKDGRIRTPSSIEAGGRFSVSRRGGVDLGGEQQPNSTYLTWRWYPSRQALKEQHVYEMGFLACAIQLFGVTLYGVTAITVLPWILDSLAPWQKLGAFWVPQVIAALCFLIASFMFMFETQEKWWKPEFGVLGWWVGFWSVVGSVGFELIAIFGMLELYGGREWGGYQSDLATIWGSGAYFIGSFLQWYEALSKNEVEELFNEPGQMKSSHVHPI